MDLSKYKFIVASGCSYGRMTDFTFRPHNFFSKVPSSKNIINSFDKQILRTENDLIVINTSLSSQGSDWQSDTTIEVVSKLLSLGIKPEMIYVLVEWSQWQRITTHPHNLFNFDLNKFDFSKRKPLSVFQVHKDDFFYQSPQNEDKQISDLFDISVSNLIENVGKIGNRIYITAEHCSTELFKMIGEEFVMFIEYQKKIDIEFPLENKLKIYFDNILRTQYFLKLNKINYNFCFMQSVLSGWFKRDWKMTPLMDRTEFNPFFMDQNNNRIIKNNNYNPVSNKNEDIEVVMPEIKNKIGSLDHNNIWTYNSDRFRKGGIDEWTIDNFKECGYVPMEQSYLSFENIICGFNSHPFITPYILLWNKVCIHSEIYLTTEYENFLWEKYFEDYNYDGFSKNYLTISKKEYYKISQGEK